jgi:hypothetical protein
MLVDGNLVSLKSMHNNEVQQGHHPPIKVLKDNVGNDGDKVVKEAISTLTTLITHPSNKLMSKTIDV